MIPKIIHYCWFGGNPIPELGVKCIESWKKYLPDYRIIKWDETNFNIHQSRYLEEAYNQKKWAFVSDYARLWILYNYGGIYFDTDVEVIRPIEDILECGPFMGTEISDGIVVNLGLGIAIEENNELIKSFLDYYDSQSFIRDDGSLNCETIVSRITSILRQMGYNGTGHKECVQGVYIYPPDFFCPKDYYTGDLNITDNSRTIHHYSASWHEVEEMAAYKKQQKITKIFGRKLGKIIYIPVFYFYRYKMRKRQLGSSREAIIWFARKLFRK